MREFLDFARAHGLLIQHVIADGRVHRCGTVEHPRKRNGAYAFDGVTGFVQAWDAHEQAIAYRPEKAVERVTPRDMTAVIAEERRRRAAAAMKAMELVKTARFDSHPYLARKGFPGHRALIGEDGRIVLPMRDVLEYPAVLNSVQWIDDDGVKKFLPGGKAKGSIYQIGRNNPTTWLCEGYATGLTLSEALRSMYQPARVIVTFSAGNLAYIAGLLKGPRFVFADHDASGTGQKVAEATGLPWCMSDVEGEDANDLMLRSGIRAVCNAMRSAM